MRSALVLILLLALSACSSNASRTSVSSTAAPNEQPSPDGILQARLQRAVAELDDHEVRRGPRYVMAGSPTLAYPDDQGPGPRVRIGVSTVVGRLPPAVVRYIVRSRSDALLRCYEAGLAITPSLRGKVVSDFTVGRDGSIGDVSTSGDLPSANMKACVKRALQGLMFPLPEGGGIKVSLPILFEPADTKAVAEKADPTAPAQPNPEASSAPLPVTKRDPLPSPEGPWPIVTLDGTAVILDGAEVGDTKRSVETGELGKIGGLYDALKKRREEWKSNHSNLRFPGVVGLRVSSKVPGGAFKCAFFTAAFAGFPVILVQDASAPSDIVELDAMVPGPPELYVEPPEPPRPQLTVRQDASELHLVWTLGAAVLSDETVTRATLASSLCAGWKERGSRHDASDPRADIVQLRLPNLGPSTDAVALTKAIATCTRRVDKGAAPSVEVPVFLPTLSIR